ncbi:ImmA/IrrE family metallo-endopeptidase [Halobacillus sp. SY10]|uniref:ImmA/IrrE family metallo-endopeptidase n=1 Tax=Halobacillus sp. SY10 TaxID=3381356 RepID=UPI003878F9A1
MILYTSLENYVFKLLNSIQVSKPDQLDIELIARNLDIDLEYWEKPSEAMVIEKKGYIFLNNALSKNEQKLDFGHELAHVLMDCGQQYGMPELFREYQEWKADAFAFHFCVPTFMLEEMDIPFDIYKATRLIQKTFKVTAEVAVKRLKQYENKRQEERYLIEMQRKCTERDRILNLWY